MFSIIVHKVAERKSNLKQMCRIEQKQCSACLLMDNFYCCENGSVSLLVYSVERKVRDFHSIGKYFMVV